MSPSPIAAALGLALLGAAPAGAQLLAPVADGRYVLVDHCPAFDPCQSDSARPPSAFAPFDDEAAVAGMSAQQSSQWSGGPEQTTATGSLAAESPSPPPLGNTVGDAVFDLTFDATAAASWTWTGAGTISGGGYGGAFLYDLTADEILFETSLPASFDASGSLAAGHRYRLFQHATALGQGSATWDLAFSALPEPGGGAPLAGGLALVAWLARRRGRLCAVDKVSRRLWVCLHNYPF